ncbi:helix-turn-helix domain-containing protein [Paractinoplanes lichenicola]|uniref:Helix-turn-helix domain-containing protein n=1 Tax=Paractinoplanes lichenicola TaxID=2802976 RepID=A0ABS1VSD4_9ACTN|nr:helix-turn-helix domain-containing protein [Actinoplanes lichenicola]MBL7257234.1 helix-turn-helix domain-containing protein [Actinoplanes lichenicola]
MSWKVTHQLPKQGRQYVSANPPSQLGVILTDRRRTRTPAGSEPLTDSPSDIEDLEALGVTTDVVTAGRFLGISRNTAYRLARRGEFPLPLIRVGAQYRVPTAALIAALGARPGAPGTEAS